MGTGTRTLGVKRYVCEETINTPLDTSQSEIIHDDALIVHYVKCDQQVQIQICKFIILQTA